MRRVLLAAFAASALTGPAMAQLSAKGGPINIASDRGEIYEKIRRVIFVGNVKVAQSDSRLECDRMVVDYRPKNGPQGVAQDGLGELDTLVCTGDVFYQTPELRAQGGKATYVSAEDTIQLEEDVVLLRGDDVARGELLVLKVGEGLTTLSAGDAGRVTNILNPDAVLTPGPGENTGETDQ